MEKISAKEIQQMTPEKALEIVQAYGAVIEHLANSTKPSTYHFESELPFDRDAIQIAIIKLLRKSDEEQSEALYTGLVLLNSFIPAPKAYQEMLRVKEATDKLFNDELKSV